MKTRYLIQILTTITIIIGCTRDMSMDEADFPTTPIVFDDTFSEGLNYAAFGSSNVSAFEVDDEVSYEGEASMRFDVPNAGNANGSYAGGVFITEIGRNLTNYDALTFWIKATESSSIDLLGFGNDFDQSNYEASISNLSVDTKWTKVIIPIPEPSKLTSEKGMLMYAEASDDGTAYTFWIDEVQFEKLGTIAHPEASIMSGTDASIQLTSGVSSAINGFSSSFNMPDGTYQDLSLTGGYFTYFSSDETVATVDDLGNVTALSEGTAVITAKLGDTEAEGSLSVNVLASLPKPDAPTVSEDSVISLFSNTYTNVTVDTWNPFWEFSTTQISEFDIEGDDYILYTDLNFVGVVFSSNLIDASNMTHLHIDVFTQDTVSPLDFTIEVIDFGSDGQFNGGDDTNISSTTSLTSGQWVPVDIDITSLSARANLAQLVLSGNDNLNNIFIDNVYFYNSGQEIVIPDAPTTAAPTPTSRTDSNVIAVFSDAYTELSGTDYPDWGQATVVSNESIDGNATLKFTGLDFQGTQFATAQNVSEMTYLHIDYWTTSSTAFDVYLISTGPVEQAYNLTVPTSGWTSVDIELTNFSGTVDLTDIVQMKYEGNGDVFLDNIYFYREDASTEPTTAAPDPPARNASDVMAVFSDAYTELSGTDYPDWGQATVVSNQSVDSNPTLVFTGLNYQGTQFASALDLTGMTHLHIDFWTANSTNLNVYLISTGPLETPYALTVPTSGWQSVDIPLTEFSSVVALNDVIQMKYDGDGDIYLDNIYFYK